MASAAITEDPTAWYRDEQRKLEKLQSEFRHWLETKEDIVRLADRRDQLLALLDAKYGYRADAAEAAERNEADPLCP
ncbi:MAG TPA: hypothetical protein VI319_05965 [Burkholderiales bacterium]